MVAEPGSWHEFPGLGAATLLDEDFWPKPAYYTVVATLAAAASAR